MKLKLNGLLALFVLLIAQLTFAQDKTVSGVVTDQSGLPIPGVNVLAKGSKTGTQTDFDGKFKVNATAGQTLVFSFTGMKTIEASAANGMKVKMADDAVQLEGLVVTALGVKKSEKAIGYAAQSIKGSSITEARESNLVNALSGKIAGVQITNSSGAVGASSRIVLRGASSITGNNQALFVVDGVPFDNSSGGSGLRGIAAAANAGSSGGRDLPNGVASLNPDDIESITVLKGPNAAALYGIRAAQGVVIITTKKGKEGNKNLGITFNSNLTFSNPLVLPDYQNSYGQSGTQGSDYFQYTDGSAGITADGTDESWGLPLDRGLSFVQWDSFKVGGAPLPWISHPNNVKDFYDTGVDVSNSLSLSSGNENGSFRFSLGNSNQKGMIPFTDFKKFNVSGNGTLKLGKNVTGSLTVNYFNDKSDNLPTVGYTGENVVQQFIWSARNVNFTDLKDWRNLPLATGGAAKGTPINWNTQFQNNPYWVLENNVNTYNRDRINGKTNISYNFAKNLTVSGGISIDHYSQVETTRQAFGSAQNQFGAGTAPNGSYTNLTKRYSEINSDFLFNYTTKLTQNIGLTMNFGGNQMKRVRTFIYGRASELELPNLYSLSNLKTGVTAGYLNDYNEQRINSIYGFGQLSYKTWFFLDFTGRNDWASVLPKSSNSFFYPSVTASLVLSDIFDTKNFGIDLLKLRGGWSKVGSTGALTAYNLNDTFTLTPGTYGNLGTVPATEFNNQLKPESVTGTEIGLDLNAFKNRLRFAASYYVQKNRDLLLPVDPSSASGFLASWQNAADMDNKGIELQLGATLIKTKDFSFDVDLNYAKNENTVVSLGGLDSYELGSQWGISLQARPGQPYGSLVGRDFERDTNGNVIMENGLPKIDATQKVIGNITPDFTGGANFTFKYKNIDLTTLIDAKIGGDIHSMSYAWGRYAGTLRETLIGREGGLVGNGVMSDGSGGYVANNVVVSAKAFNQTAYGNDVESSAIFDASYVKLRQISIGYSFSKKLLQGSSLDGLKLSLVARNIAILYKEAPHIDPESAFSSANGEQGQEFGQLPSARTIGFNLNVKF
jgi:TonB-linked SusC/RagA family outer membrane protein